MTTSVSLLEGLFEVINEQISFFCHIFHDGKLYYMCLARHSMLLLDEGIKKIRADIPYSTIELVLYDKWDPTIM